jgi:WD40 repeat protein
MALEGHTHHVLGVSFKADGRTLASTAADGQVKFWDLVSGERRGAVVPPVGTEVTSVRFVGITDQAMVGSADHQVRVVNDNGAIVRAFSGPPGDHIHSAALAGDAKTYVTVGQSGSMYVWDAVAGKLIATFAPPPATTTNAN